MDEDDLPREGDQLMDNSEKKQHADGRSEGGCLQCLARFPIASTVAWVVTLAGVGAFTGSLYLAANRTEAWLHLSKDVFSFVNLAVIIVPAVTVALATIFYIVNYICSAATTRRCVTTTNRNTHARNCSAFILVIAHLLSLIWILVFAVMAAPLVMFAILHILIDRQNVDCINLRAYGLGDEFYDNGYRDSKWDKDICDYDLDVFYRQGKDVLICYIACFASALLVVLGLIQFVICITSNIRHLRETRITTFNVYADGHSHNSIVETKL